MQSSSPTWPCTLDGIDGIAGFMRLIHSRKCMGNAYMLVFHKPKISHAGCTFSFTSGNFVNLILRQNRRMWSWIKRPASIGTYQFWALQMSVLSQKIYEAFHTWVCTHHITLFDTMILETFKFDLWFKLAEYPINTKHTNCFTDHVSALHPTLFFSIAFWNLFECASSASFEICLFWRCNGESTRKGWQICSQLQQPHRAGNCMSNFLRFS